MSPDKIREMIQEAIPGSQVEMSGADCNFAVTVTSAEFEGKSPIQRHRMVNDVFKTQFETGELHALSIKTKVQ
ncbi:MAG: BolA/IbaG family iron-sulfur metabolism protein [Thiomicrorhabdus chilensis]|uniref:BolA family protein n=1 Tax=Thiomicrorhabdus chilensis TaxID=63656 RepID=UPI0004902049|nr:BolA/IbaG family iron-sulfur metabolism protein [Thiomicrorhabdus chilensis]MDX1347372.1 BolA/IbaG family iron-sulfur metabolism protein [Thiomicrorhabdus chilensis]